MRRALALLLLVPLLAMAAPPLATISWTPAYTRTDTSSIPQTPGALVFTVYQRRTDQGPTYSVTYHATASPLVLTSGLVGGKTYCWAGTETEVATGLESAYTNEACKFIPPTTAPTSITIH